MPDLAFSIDGVEPAARGLTPLLHFKLAVTNTPAEETVHAAIVQVQIQVEAPQRVYNAREKEKLLDLFGTPDRWGQTLRNKLWAHTHACLSRFTGRTEAVLPLACTCDLNLTATKYFNALEGGEVPLLFLFSGTVFYAAADGRLQVQPISWNKECGFRMPVERWQQLMDHHYPNSAFLPLRRDVFDRLCACQRLQGFATWEQTIEHLLALQGQESTGFQTEGADA